MPGCPGRFSGGAGFLLDRTLRGGASGLHGLGVGGLVAGKPGYATGSHPSSRRLARLHPIPRNAMTGRNASRNQLRPHPAVTVVAMVAPNLHRRATSRPAPRTWHRPPPCKPMTSRPAIALATLLRLPVVDGRKLDQCIQITVATVIRHRSSKPDASQGWSARDSVASAPAPEEEAQAPPAPVARKTGRSLPFDPTPGATP